MGRTLRWQLGVRFHPTDAELVVFYLKRKVIRRRFHPRQIAEVDIYKLAPWNLKEKSISKSGDLKWYFFCPVEKKYANGCKLNRSTKFGFWKSTGKCKPVRHNEMLVGLRRTMIFYSQSKEQRERTDWVMHEYSLDYNNLGIKRDVQKTYMLCKIFQKEGRGPRNGAQYVESFKEEDLSDGSDCSDVEEADCAEDVTLPGRSTTSSMLPDNNISSADIGTTSLVGTISESCLSETLPLQCEGISGVPPDNVSSKLYQVSGEILPAGLADDEVVNSMLAYRLEGNTMISCGDEKDKNQSHDEIDREGGLSFDEWIDTIIDWDSVETARPSGDGCIVQENLSRDEIDRGGGLSLDEWTKTIDWHCIETAGPSLDGCDVQEASFHQEGISMDDLNSDLVSSLDS